MSQPLKLSLVLPAYNESGRLPPYLRTIRPWLDSRYGGRYEVVVVDDGSTDGLSEVAEHFARDWPQLRQIRHDRNQGKGAAVRTGVGQAQGELVLFADADGATPIEEEARLAAAIQAGADLAVGSRLLTADGTHCRRDRRRALAGRLFAAVARRMFRLSVRDTQCGFKMFRQDAARRLFSSSRENGYLFDIELLALAERHGYRTVEVAINWTEQPGSHFSMARNAPAVLRELWRLRRRLRAVGAVAPCAAPAEAADSPDSCRLHR